MWLFTYNHTCFGYIQITTLNNKNTFGAPYIWSFQEDGETFVKTMSDCWIVGRKSDQRELFVILNQKNANLIEIDGKWFHIRYINSTSCYRS